MRVVKITMLNNTCVLELPVGVPSILDDIDEFLWGAGVGDKCTVEIVDITPEEFANLPEFEGW